ncbi:MAG: hypothetical protein J6T29_02615 [Alphaproteobacteria bacterium]|nr:hypothetical protein [Alphaproteobacteria bacterium]
MKKALIIANMIFASATVWGMVPNDGRCDHQTGNHFNMKNLKEEIENIKEISPAKKSESLYTEIIDGYEKFFNTTNEAGYTPMQVAKNRENQIIKVKNFFETVQADSKDDKFLPKEIKLLVSKLKFEDIFDYVKKSQIQKQKPSTENCSIIEESAKKKAKNILYRVLTSEEFNKKAEDKELRKYLYEISMESIDSAKCIWNWNPTSYVNSSGIVCYYSGENCLIKSLLHETGHVLDLAYRLKKKFGSTKAKDILMDENRLDAFMKELYSNPSNNRCKENVSIFCESLLKTDLFDKDFAEGDSVRLYGFFWKLIDDILISKLAMSNDERLSKFILKDYTIDEARQMISELRSHDIIGPYVDTFLEFRTIDTNRPFFDIDKENKWRDFLQKLDGNYPELSPLFCGIAKGESDISSGYHTIVKEEITFFKDHKNIKLTLPNIYGISWNEVMEFVCGELENDAIQHKVNQLLKILDNNGYTRLSSLLRDTKKRKSKIVDYKPSKDVLTHFIFCKGLEKIKVELPQDGTNWNEIRDLAFGKSLYYQTALIFNQIIRAALYSLKKNEVIPLDRYILGTFKAFNMIKKLDSLKLGEVMKELTEPTKSSITEKYAEEFMEFLIR